MIQAVTAPISIAKVPQKKFVRFRSTAPTILIATDEDDSRLPWLHGVENYRSKFHEEYLENNKNAFKSLADKAFIIGATGLDFKSLQWIQERTKILNGFPPTDIEITDNGLEIRVNENGILPEEWFNPQIEILPNSEYELYVQKEAGYEREIFYKALTSKLKELGFVKINDSNNFLPMALPNCIVYEIKGDLPTFVIFSSGESAFYFIGNDENKNDYDRLYNDLAKGILKEYNELTGKKKNIKYEVSGHGNYAYIFFSPNNGIEISKETAFNSSLEFLPKYLRAKFEVAIAVGDSRNDKHLIPHTVEIDGKSIPRHSVITGNKLANEEWLQSHPRLFWIPEEPGNVGPAILEIISSFLISKKTDVDSHKTI